MPLEPGADYHVPMCHQRLKFPCRGALALGVVALLCMVLLQIFSLHMHNHAPPTHDQLPAVHVAGAGSHGSTHDDAGEIVLSIDGLLLKQPFGDFVFVLFSCVLVSLVLRREARRGPARSAPRLRPILFVLRPPAQAPPR